MNISGSGESKPTLNRSAQVRQNVAKQIITDDHVVLRRIEHHVHRHRIDVLMVRFDLRITGCYFLENTLPKIAAEALHV